MSADGFDGKVVVVTGAGQGVGRVIALTFAGAGAKVVLASRSEGRLDAVAAEIGAAGGSAYPIPTDLRDPASVERLRDQVAEQLGPTDVLVNNSAIGGPSAPLWEVSLEDWEETLRVNLTGVFLGCRAFLPAMVEAGKGNIVVIGSMTGKRPLYARSPYAASKTGLIGLVRTLAWETGPASVRVNMISPGAIPGERLDWVIAKQAESRGISLDEARADFAKSSPLQRFVDPEDIAAAALFLASDAAHSITGEDLNVSAGCVTYG